MPTFTDNGRTVKELKGVGKPVQIDADLKGKLMEYLDANKNDPDFQKFIDAGSGGMPSKVDMPVISAARKRLEKLRLQECQELVPFEYDGDKLAIRKLNYLDLGEVALSVARDGHSVLSVNDSGGINTVTKTILLACVATEDGDPYFTYSDLCEYMNDARQTGFLSQLFLACNEVNPDILTTLKKT